MKRLLAVMLSAILLTFLCLTSFASDTMTFSVWTDNNRYVGEEEASTLAAKLDRANLAYIISESFNLETKYKIEIKDVPQNHWAYKYICAVVANNIMNLEDERFFPDEYVKREEIPQYFKFLNISYPPVGELKFKDISDISSEYEDLFKRYVTAGYIQPVTGEYLLPTRIITITETVNMLNKMFPNVSNKVLKESIYDGHFLLRGSNTYLSNIEITGDLIITEGLILRNKNFENNNVGLDNVKVHGNIYIMGGSLKGKFVLNNVSADKIVIVGDEPVIMSFSKCEFNEIDMGSSLANIVTDKQISINRN